MNPLWTGGIVTLIALVFLFSGMPIAFALGVTSLIAIFLFMDVYQISMMAETIYEGVNDFSLLSIPLFLLMGMIVALSRAGGDLYECFHRWLYKIPGGLGIGNIAGCAVFAALTGSSPATAAAIGTMGIPEMRKRGYPNGLATGIITAGGTLGILIPPSVTMIIYGIATETSIGKLFIAGIIPGIMVALLFAAWVPLGYTLGRRNNPDNFPPEKTESFTLAQKFASTLKVVPFIAVVMLVLGSLYTGWATPSEAAAVGAFLILIIAIIFYKMYRPKEIMEILLKTTSESTMIMMIIATSFLFGAVLTNLFIAQTLTHMITEMQVSRWVTMFMINVLLLVMGCFLPPVAIILIVSPIIHPIVKALGFDPIWFGVLMTLNLEAGLITPPVGLNLYVVKGIAPGIPLSTILWGSLPFIFLLFFGMFILCLFPQLATWLPGMMIR